MRIMLRDNNSKLTVEIASIGYSENLGGFARCAGKKGLFMCDVRGDIYYIEGVSKDKCDNVCQEVLEKGFTDISDAGRCELWETLVNEMMEDLKEKDGGPDEG